METDSKASAVKYYYSLNTHDDPAGPVSLDELRILAARKEIGPQTPIIREGAAEWGRYRDVQTGERTREVADAVAIRAARVANALRTDESRNFGLGLLISIVYLVALPWDLITGAARKISDWGSSRFISLPRASRSALTLGEIAAPVWILFWTAWWMTDCVCMLIVGRPSFTLSIASMFSGFWTMGLLPYQTELSGRMMYASAKASFTEAITVQDFGNRLAWMIKFAVAGYFLTGLWSLFGETFLGLAALISLRKRSSNFPDASDGNGDRP